MGGPSSNQRTEFDLACPSLKPLYTHGRISSTDPTSAVPGRIIVPCNDTVNILTLKPQLCIISAHRVNTDDSVSACAISSNGSIIVVAALSTFATIWSGGDDGSGREKHRLRPFVDGVASFCDIDDEEKHVGFATVEGRIKIFDMERGIYTHAFSTASTKSIDGDGGSGNIACMRFRKKEGRLCVMVGLEDGALAIFDLGSKKARMIWAIRPHAGAISCFAFINDCERVVVAARDKSMSVVDMEAGKIVKTLVTDEPLESIVLFDESNVVLTAGEWGILRLWDIESGKCLSERTFSLPLCSGKNHNAEVDDDDTLEEKCSIVDVVKHGSHAIFVTMSDQSMYSVDVPDKGPVSIASQFCGNLQEIYDVRVLPLQEGRSMGPILVASNSSALRVVRPTGRKSDKESANKGREVSVDAPEAWACDEILQGHQGIVLALDVLQDGGPDGFLYAASSSRDRSARVWRANHNGGNWVSVGKAEGHTDAVGAVALSPSTKEDDLFMVTAAADRTLKYWPLKSMVSDLRKSTHDKVGGQFVSSLHARWTVLAHDKDVNAVAVSANKNTIATGSQDRTVKLWNSQNGSLVAECRGHRRGVWSVGFSQTERLVASASGDSTVRIWSEEDGACLRTFEGHMAGVLKVVFMSGGSQVATSGADGLVKVWSTYSGVCNSTLDAHEDHAWALSSIAEGKYLVSGGADGEVKVWKDVTDIKAEECAQLQDKKELMTQKTHDATQAHQWERAIGYALELDLHRELKKILTRMITTTVDPRTEMLKVVDNLCQAEDSNDKIFALLKHCRKWNTVGGPSNAALASFVFQSVFTRWSPENVSGPYESEQGALVEAIDVHTLKYFNRISNLGARARFLDYVIESMQR